MKFQISLRELMLVMLVVGLMLAGLTTGGWFASLLLLLIIVVSTALAIVAFVGHGRRRAFAVGYLIPLFVYIAIHAYAGASELDPFAYVTLPTTKLWGPVFEQLVRRDYVDSFTGEFVAKYDPTKNQAFLGGGSGGGGFGGGGGGPSFSIREIPDRKTFMLLAHALVAMALGYAGGKFALCVHYQETNRKFDSEATPPE